MSSLTVEFLSTMFRRMALLLVAAVFIGSPLRSEEKQHTSRAECPMVLAAMLKAMEQATGSTQWLFQTPQQKAYLREEYPVALNRAVRVPQIKTKAGEVEEVNEFLAEEGFSIRLNPGTGTAAAGVFRAKMVWSIAKANVGNVKAQNRREYPAFYLNDCAILPSAGGVPVMELKTAGAERLYVSELLEAEYSWPVDVILKARAGLPDVAERRYVTKMHVPMVNLRYRPNLSWLVGLITDLRDRLDQVVQETIFQMDEFGVVAKSGAAGLTSKSLSLPEVIDQPFVAWIERPEVGIVYSAVCHYDSWQDPKVKK